MNVFWFCLSFFSPFRRAGCLDAATFDVFLCSMSECFMSAFFDVCSFYVCAMNELFMKCFFFLWFVGALLVLCECFISDSSVLHQCSFSALLMLLQCSIDAPSIPLRAYLMLLLCAHSMLRSKAAKIPFSRFRNSNIPNSDFEANMIYLLIYTCRA